MSVKELLVNTEFQTLIHICFFLLFKTTVVPARLATPDWVVRIHDLHVLVGGLNS